MLPRFYTGVVRRVKSPESIVAMEQSVKFKGPGPRSCGCKGTRSCLVCNPLLHESHTEEINTKCPGLQQINQRVFDFCHLCGTASQINVPNKCEKQLNTDIVDAQPVCHHGKELRLDFHGIHIFENFVSEEEERYLDTEISKTAFVNSQSGRRKQDFGPKVNFKKQKLKVANFSGLPLYSEFLYKRMMSLPVLSDFCPVEMCNLEYSDERGAHIDPHFDDFWVWGERLVTVNLCSESILSFTKDSEPDVVVRVPMPRRSLLVVFGPARYEWKHGIHMKDINGRRIAMTFRELSAEFQAGGMRHEEGQALGDLALTFRGHAVGS